MNTNDAESWIVNLIKNARLGIWGWHFFRLFWLRRSRIQDETWIVKSSLIFIMLNPWIRRQNRLEKRSCSHVRPGYQPSPTSYRQDQKPPGMLGQQSFGFNTDGFWNKKSGQPIPIWPVSVKVTKRIMFQIYIGVSILQDLL